MKLNFAIICDNAFIDKEGRLTVVQTFNIIKSQSFPAIHPRLTVVTNYSSDNDDPTQELEHLVRILDPDGKEISNLVIKREGVKKETQFISYFSGLPFEKPGIYKVEILLNNENQKTLPLPLQTEKAAD